MGAGLVTPICNSLWALPFVVSGSKPDGQQMTFCPSRTYHPASPSLTPTHQPPSPSPLPSGMESGSDKLFAGANQAVSDAFSSIRVIHAYNLRGSVSSREDPGSRSMRDLCWIRPYVQQRPRDPCTQPARISERLGVSRI